jgi:septum formation protein
LANKKVIVLASNSPRRKQILALGGWDFLILPAEINEDPYPGEGAQPYVLRMAEQKAREASQKAPPNSLVLGADTSVILIDEKGGEVILGKPADENEAGVMLEKLRGKVHYVYTGLSIINTVEDKQLSETCSTAVKMRDYSVAEVEAYISTGDPMDKAGAYAIQHLVFDPVESLEGCYTNVVGLPLCLVERLLFESGFQIKADITRECKPENSQPCLVYRRVLEMDQTN